MHISPQSRSTSSCCCVRYECLWPVVKTTVDSRHGHDVHFRLTHVQQSRCPLLRCLRPVVVPQRSRHVGAGSAQQIADRVGAGVEELGDGLRLGVTIKPTCRENEFGIQFAASKGDLAETLWPEFERCGFRRRNLMESRRTRTFYRLLPRSESGTIDPCDAMVVRRAIEGILAARNRAASPRARRGVTAQPGPRDAPRHGSHRVGA